MTTNDKIEYIWLYSKCYGDMLFTAQRLYNDGEGYAATVIIFNAAELIFKSVRENFEDNFNQDITRLFNCGWITESEKDFFDNKRYGIREIRNKMTHREAYQYCLGSPSGKVLPFIEADTWLILYEQYAPLIVDILYNVLQRSREAD